jgi:integrase
VTGTVRPFHDGRHTAITHDAASGSSPLSLMKRAGHADFKTTQRYIDLAAETFREDAERAQDRLLGEVRSGA